MKTFLSTLAILLLLGCAATGGGPKIQMIEPPEAKSGLEAQVGPCYGGGEVMPNVMACFYDVDQDENPDIILMYSWDGESLSLIQALMPEEFNEFLGTLPW